MHSQTDSKELEQAKLFLKNLASTLERTISNQSDDTTELEQLIRHILKPKHETEEDAIKEKMTAQREIDKIKRLVTSKDRHHFVFNMTNSLTNLLNLKYSVSFDFEDVQHFNRENSFSQTLTHNKIKTPSVTTVINFLIDKLIQNEKSKHNNNHSTPLNALDLTIDDIQDSFENANNLDDHTLNTFLENFLLEGDDDEEKEKKKERILEMIMNETDENKKLEMIREHFPELYYKIVNQPAPVPENKPFRKKKNSKSPSIEEEEKQKKKFGPSPGQPGGFLS